MRFFVVFAIGIARFCVWNPAILVGEEFVLYAIVAIFLAESFWQKQSRQCGDFFSEQSSFW